MRQATKKHKRRQYSAEFKKEVLAQCRQPGASIASVAALHGINANLVHKWRRAGNCDAARRRSTGPASKRFIALPLPLATTAPSLSSEIRIELRRGPTAVSIRWPTPAAAECASWLRELLK